MGKDRNPHQGGGMTEMAFSIEECTFITENHHMVGEYLKCVGSQKMNGTMWLFFGSSER